MIRFLWVCLGGAIGSGARYLVSGWALRLFGTLLPFGTLAVNLIGSFLIGALMHAALTTELFSPTARLTLSVGVLGGFTTYSGFNSETIHYLQEGARLSAFLNIFIMVTACLAAGIGGVLLARWLVGSH